MARPWIIGILIGYGIIAAVAMIVLGWAESTPTQVVLLELAALPLQAALALGLWQLGRRMRAPGPRGRLALRVAAGLAGLGLVLVGLAYLTGPRGLVHAGLAVVWVGLLAAMLVVITHLPRHRLRTDSLFSVIPDPDEDDEDEGDEDDDAPEPLAPAPAVAPSEGDR